MAEICVIIPAFNAQRYLSQAVESVISQSWSDWELIIVDDGSTDRTKQLACHYASIDSRIRVYQKDNSGVANTRNYGFRLASSDTKFVLFLDHDDYLEQDALEMLRSLLVASTQAVAAYGFFREVDSNGDSITASIKKAFGFERYAVAFSGEMINIDSDEPTTFASFVIWPCIGTPGQVLIRYQALRSVGGFDPNTVPSDDWDMWLRLSLLGSFIPVMRFTVNKRVHGANLSANGKLMARAEPIIRKKLAASIQLDESNKRIARLGHFYSCIHKFRWSIADLKQHRYLNASKNMYRALISYIRFCRTPYSPNVPMNGCNCEH